MREQGTRLWVEVFLVPLVWLFNDESCDFPLVLDP